ncbi:cache domain-containing sensor histidine kinase [Paenibacillus oleatilyticus]|uniref:cache domain-containing sensor histidine kinase n=1 Tax=Paenibacillus oleatilyticus TaxID=2594886 RepID=UPI001C1FD7DC|nr:sensor histidine kinase [Paenibacillus oleatilyticus]MBU7315091.1 sensor histidine kinase [Paenibacillus oleatilyticus]
MADWIRKLKNNLLGTSLQTKLLLAVLPLAIIPLAVLGTFSYHKSAQVVQQQVCQTILESLSQVNYSLDYFVKDIEQLTMYIYSSRDIQDVLSKPADRPLAEKHRDKQRVGEVLDTFLGFKNWDISIYLLGENGDRYFTGDLLPGAYDDYNASWGLFRKMRLAGGNVVWDTHYSMKKTDDFGIVLSSGRLLKRIDTNAPLGYLVVDMMENALADKYKKAHLQPGGQMLLLDRNGYIISSTPSKHKVGTKLEEPFVDRVLAGGKGFFEQAGEGTPPVMVVYDTSEVTGFKLVNVLPVAALTRESSSIRNLTLLVIAVGAAVSCVLAYLLSVNITHPLRKLKSLMRTVETGNLDVAFPTKYKDEVGQLGRSFNAMVQRIKQLIDEVYKKQLMLQEAEIRAIQAQFNPHFLYNALDSINWMARIHKLDHISRTVVSLGELLRFSIRKGQALIPVREDMQQIRNFLTIQQMRYGDKLEVHIELEEEVERLYTLKLILQPIVENAITHGLEMKRGPGHLWITGKVLGERVRFEVRDDGVGIPQEKLERITSGQFVSADERKTGIGLENVKKRLQLYFGDRYVLRLSSQPQQGTITTIEIPIIRTPGEDTHV